MWANYTVFLAAKVCCFIWYEAKNMDDATMRLEQSTFSNNWLDVWAELRAWHQNCPAGLLELDFHEDDDDPASSPFPFVLFAAPCAISSNQLYHTTCLLLLDIKPLSVDLSYTGSTRASLWHARRICGISATNTIVV
jgi:hypothetical protein